MTYRVDWNENSHGYYTNVWLDGMYSRLPGAYPEQEALRIMQRLRKTAVFK